MSEVEKLPQGWVKATVDDLAEFVNGFAFKPAHWEPTGTPIIRIQNLTNSEKPFNYTKIDVPEIYEVNNGDLLVSWSATLDAFIWRGNRAWLNQHIFKVVPRPRFFHSGLLFYWMKIAIEEMITTEHLHGSTMKHINRGPFLAHETRLPPSNEQARIFDKLEELFSELDAGVKELKAAQTKLSQYRQSLLKSAVEGSLTEQWRAENRAQVQETGEKLLARILKQRREQWQQQKLAEFAEKGKTPPKGWQDAYPEPVQPDTSDLAKLPDGWVWASLSQVGWLERGKSKHRPRNAEHLYGGVYPFVQTGEIRSAEQYIRHTEKTYSEEGLKQSKLWPKGTMCITIAANIGETAILEIDACFPDSIVGFSTIVEDMPIEYVEYVFRVLKHKLDDEAPATAQKNINLEILYKEAIPLPPVIEQLVIVEYLNAELKNIKLQKTATALGLKQSEAQRKNILKSAFSGQLVPQDPNDEPASVLLEKIKRKREALAKMPKPRKPNKPKKNGGLMNTLLEVLTAENDWIDAQDAFQKCGIVNGTSTDRIEEIYTELRKLEKAGKIQIQRQGNFDQLKLTTQVVKED